MIVGSFAEALRTGRRQLPLQMFNMARATEKELHENITKRTPVASGTLLASIERKGITRAINVYFGGVKSELERASFTEDDTAPHIIRPRDPSGEFLSYIDKKTGKKVNLKEVHHPGTTGVHMFAKGAAETEANIDTRAEAMLTRWKQSSGL